MIILEGMKQTSGQRAFTEHQPDNNGTAEPEKIFPASLIRKIEVKG